MTTFTDVEMLSSCVWTCQNSSKLFDLRLTHMDAESQLASAAALSNADTKGTKETYQSGGCENMRLKTMAHTLLPARNSQNLIISCF